MNLEDLQKIYQEDIRIQESVKSLKNKEGVKLLWSGLRGSSLSILASAIYSQHKTHQLFVAPDREQAQFLQNDLETFYGSKPISYFPAPFKNEGSFKESATDHVLLRTEALNNIKDGRKGPQILVSYPEALFEKVISQEELSLNTFEAEVKSKLDVDFMMEFLQSYHFDNVEFVYEPGTFSIRGGIIDIFSFANDLPYRIVLFDDEVESIKVFDPETQLSVKRLNKVTIIPNVQAEENNFKRISLMDFLPSETLVILLDSKFLVDKLGALEDKYLQELNEYRDANEKDKDQGFYLTPENFDSKEVILKGISKFSTIEVGVGSIYKNPVPFEFRQTPQPDFNKNFKLLGEIISNNQNKNFQTIIFSDQAKQVERIYAIFEDLSIKTEFFPIYKILHDGFIDLDKGLAIYSEHHIFGRYQRYKGKKSFKQGSMTLKELYDLKPGDYVTHIDYGVGVFSGLEKITNDGKIQEAIRLKYRGGDLLYVNIHSLHKISRYVGQEGKLPKMNKLGTGVWENLKTKTKKQVKDIARDLIKLYAERKSRKGFAFEGDNYMQMELEASFMYEDTPDQAKSTADVKRDMESGSPMDRLICGDVGFGKTEIAIRAAFKSAVNGKQTAILVPTTVLALQHYKTFKKRLAEFPVTVDFISRFKTAANQKETLKKVEEGKVDILIGTHRILGKDLKFKDLGLLIIDEEQKFGVAAKEKLRTMKSNVDTLTLTATPIPRTLSFSLMGARDMSIINTPPPNRQPINTRLEVFSKEIIQEAIENEVARGGQVFFVHNRIKDLFQYGELIQALVPQAKVAVAHAQMEATYLEEIMTAFIEGYYDVFVSTNIVEAGLDIPNANTIIIDGAQNFGLSDLYQLRGRVGRSNKKAYCILLAPPKSVLTEDARKRLSALEEHTELGSGFQIAMKDLDIRGAGNLLGAEQSGFIAEIGLEMYQKILQEAMQEIKEDEFADLFPEDEDSYFKRETIMETDLELMIPDRYVISVNERIGLYTTLNDLKTNDELIAFEDSLEDRFGPVPFPTKELLRTVELRWIAQSLAAEKIVLKRGRMRLHFGVKKSEKIFKDARFGVLVDYITAHPLKCKFEQKESEFLLTIDGVKSVKDALAVFREIGM